MGSILAGMFEHNRWANLLIADACGSATDAQLDSTVDGTAGSVRDTLMHVAGAEQRYIRTLSGRQPTYAELDGWPGIGKLRQVLDESGRILVELAGQANPDEVLRGERGGERYEYPVATLYVQAINHATEHRSQIATILTQQGLEPPDMSGWAWGDP
jgi:uncharacterized damage-inducible protein DinB